tara:strand:+ start:283 stop:510 length:228 start_codon:yes stop_codon:yes gene_type:complete
MSGLDERLPVKSIYARVMDVVDGLIEYDVQVVDKEGDQYKKTMMIKRELDSTSAEFKKFIQIEFLTKKDTFSKIN